MREEESESKEGKEYLNVVRERGEGRREQKDEKEMCVRVYY